MRISNCLESKNGHLRGEDRSRTFVSWLRLRSRQSLKIEVDSAAAGIELSLLVGKEGLQVERGIIGPGGNRMDDGLLLQLRIQRGQGQQPQHAGHGVANAIVELHDGKNELSTCSDNVLVQQCAQICSEDEEIVEDMGMAFGGK